MNLHIFEVKNGEHEYTDFCVSSNDILNEKDAISYMYGEDTLDREEDVRKGVQYYTFGDSWVGLYKTFTNVSKKEKEVLEKFYVI
tara:strand:+ start:124 stop:378 length:255 start_codon:yes stop_codon:yes gene_type:complete